MSTEQFYTKKAVSVLLNTSYEKFIEYCISDKLRSRTKIDDEKEVTFYVYIKPNDFILLINIVRRNICDVINFRINNVIVHKKVIEYTSNNGMKVYVYFPSSFFPQHVLINKYNVTKLINMYQENINFELLYHNNNNGIICAGYHKNDIYDFEIGYGGCISSSLKKNKEQKIIKQVKKEFNEEFSHKINHTIQILNRLKPFVHYYSNKFIYLFQAIIV